MVRWLPLLLAFGCGDARIEGESAAPTWYGEVGPLLVERCGACHRDEGLGAYSMQRYEDVAPWADAILAAIDAGTMPPWAATESEDCAPEVPFRDDPRLSADERDLVARWVEAGAPAGAPRELPLPDTGELANPTIEVSLPTEFAVSGSRDVYQCFRIEVPHDEDVWITGMQVKPGNDLVVHHVLVWNDPTNGGANRAGPDGSYPCSGQPDVWPTDLIGGWTPGTPPTHNPEGTGTLFKAGASLVVNVHYHPTGNTTEFDQTRIALEWTTVKPANYVTYYMVDLPFGAESEPGPADDGGPEFFIPAGRPAHRENLSFDPYRYLPLPVDLPVFAIMPHMHFRGTDMLVRVEHPDGSESCLIDARDYRFDYQNNYTYDVDAIDQMPKLSEGDVLKIRCTYDNSWSNPFMQDALDAAGETKLVDVRWGEETGDEMCMAVIGIVIPPVDISQWL